MARPEVVQARLRRVLLSAAAAAVLLAAAALWLSFALPRRAAPTLTPQPSPLAEALGWPWSDFPPVTDWERERVRAELQIGAALAAADVTPLTGAAARAAAGGLSGAAAAALAAVEPAAHGPAADPAARAAAIDALTRVLNRGAGADAWLLHYDRGVLLLDAGRPGAAVRDLGDALAGLRRRIDGSFGADRVRAQEAAIHAHYALAHALLARGGDQPPLEVRREALRQLRFALGLVGLVHPFHPEALATRSDFRVLGDLSTLALWNDLVANYMLMQGYHDCERRPDGVPADAAEGPCAYRDTSFAASRARVGPPLRDAYLRLYERFYRGGAWEQEHLLWALSNLVDLTAEDPRLFGDAHLLANAATVMVELGELESAAELAGAAQRSIDFARMDPADAERVARLATVVHVLAQRPVNRRPGGGGGEPTLVRRRFLELVPDAERELSFPPLGDAFPDAADAAFLDQWLFIHRWRRLLAAGDLETFLAEQRALVAAAPASADFFRRWRREVMGELGRRALARAEALERAPEPDRAALIRAFVAREPAFPGDLRRAARGDGWWLGPLALWLLRAAVVGAAVLAVAAAIGLLRLHRAVGLGHHHRERRRAAGGA